jgi:Molybdopterin biosynthesis enzymes
MPISSQKEFKPINISVLTISDTRTEANDTSGQFLAKHVREKGHGLSHKQIVKDNKEDIKKILLDWCSNKEVDVIITTGGTGLTGRDTTQKPLMKLKIKTFQVLANYLD